MQFVKQNKIAATDWCKLLKFWVISCRTFFRTRFKAQTFLNVFSHRRVFNVLIFTFTNVRNNKAPHNINDYFLGIMARFYFAS